jgi:hypothetical protein
MILANLEKTEPAALLESDNMIQKLTDSKVTSEEIAQKMKDA